MAAITCTASWSTTLPSPSTTTSGAPPTTASPRRPPPSGRG
uniref:Uncharacterized protein n=1 Tax=Arundo donax TaxID=35708 RepID=A0A0A9C3Q3_ARUDO